MRRAALWFAAFLAALVPVASAQNPPQVPEWVVYWHVFHDVAQLNRMADNAAREGNDQPSLRTLVARRARLNDNDAQTLKRIALQCESDVAALDAKAQVIILRFRAQFPYGIATQGMPLPPPPPELRDLQRQRDSIILSARDSLRAALGEEAFLKLDSFMKRQTSRPPHPGPVRRRLSAGVTNAH
jgi:hypothetical protein